MGAIDPVVRARCSWHIYIKAEGTGSDLQGRFGPRRNGVEQDQ